jgi:hypothetical protein
LSRWGEKRKLLTVPEGIDVRTFVFSWQFVWHL